MLVEALEEGNKRGEADNNMGDIRGEWLEVKMEVTSGERLDPIGMGLEVSHISHLGIKM